MLWYEIVPHFFYLLVIALEAGNRQDINIACHCVLSCVIRVNEYPLYLATVAHIIVCAIIAMPSNSFDFSFTVVAAEVGLTRHNVTEFSPVQST